MTVETSERQDGPTPNGGTYSIAYWQDAQGRPVEKAEAVAAEVIEFTDDGQQVFRTYMTIGPTA